MSHIKNLKSGEKKIKFSDVFKLKSVRFICMQNPFLKL